MLRLKYCSAGVAVSDFDLPKLENALMAASSMDRDTELSYSTINVADLASVLMCEGKIDPAKIVLVVVNPNGTEDELPGNDYGFDIESSDNIEGVPVYDLEVRRDEAPGYSEAVLEMEDEDDDQEDDEDEWQNGGSDAPENNLPLGHVTHYDLTRK